MPERLVETPAIRLIISFQERERFRQADVCRRERGVRRQNLPKYLGGGLRVRPMAAVEQCHSFEVQGVAIEVERRIAACAPPIRLCFFRPAHQPIAALVNRLDR